MSDLKYFIFFFFLFSFMSIISLLAYTFSVKDEKGFIKKYWSPFFLDGALFLNSILFILDLVCICFLFFLIERDSQTSFDRFLSPYSYVVFVLVSLSLFIFFVLRLTLRQRVKNAGYKVGIFKEENGYLYVGDGLYLKVDTDTEEDTNIVEEYQEIWTEKEIKEIEDSIESFQE